jgi:hypothetical protein
MKARARTVLIAACVVTLARVALQELPLAAQGPSLGLTRQGARLALNGAPGFLVFVSYFDALRASPGTLRSDFAYLKDKGVDGVRVFPNWWRYDGEYARGGTFYYAQDTLMAPDGSLREGPLSRLLDVLDAAREHGLVVDISFSAESVAHCPADNCRGGPGYPDISSLDLARLRDGLAALARVLARTGSAHRHVIVDIQNESDKDTNGPIDRRPLSDDPGAVRTLVNAIHHVDPQLVVTASLGGGAQAPSVIRFTRAGGLDALAWHEPRETRWWDATAARVAALRGAGLPVYLQEPEPRGDAHWTREGITANVVSAFNSGAAAWCFHTRAGFHLGARSLQSQLAPDEAAFLDTLKDVLPDR